jgi:hypothetical protein
LCVEFQFSLEKETSRQTHTERCRESEYCVCALWPLFRLMDGQTEESHQHPGKCNSSVTHAHAHSFGWRRRRARDREDWAHRAKHLSIHSLHRKDERASVANERESI